MKTILSLSLALMLAATSAYARNPNGGNQGPSAPSPSTPSAPAIAADTDASATRTNYAMVEDGIARKPASNFCVTWSKDAYCAKN